MVKKSRYQIRKQTQKQKAKPRFAKVKREAFDLGVNIKDVTSYIRLRQEEIALAKRAGDSLELAKKIEEVLHSREAHIIAVHRVVTNRGYRSRGLSEGSFTTNEDYSAMVDALGQIITQPDTYKAQPLDRIYLPKPNGGLRPISIPSYLDRCLQALYKLVYEPITEETSDVSSFGFRPIRNIYWAAGRVLNCLNNPFANYNYAISFDIAKYFDKISHNTIKDITDGIIPNHIMSQWLECGYIERESSSFSPTAEGIPQGGVISPTIGNHVLDGLEAYLKETSATPAKGGDSGGAMVRYADDIIYFVRSYAMAERIIKAMQEFLKPRGLSLNTEKTKVYDLNLEAFEFVGFEFCKIFRRNRKRLSAYIKIPKSAIKSFRAKVNKKSRETKMLTKFIDEINPIILGWANNYRYSHDFRYVSKGLQYWLWKKVYAKAYHIYKKSNNKANHQKLHELVMQNFSPHEEFSSWPAVIDAKGKRHILAIITKPESVNPKYTNQARNPYISEDRVILDKTALGNMSKFRKAVLEKWGFCCGKCGTHIGLSGVPFEVHHKRPRQFGGDNTVNNLVPLCREPCHVEVSTAVARRDLTTALEYIYLDILKLPDQVLMDWATSSQ